MILKNRCTEFDLSSIPSVVKQGYETKNGVRLDVLQDYCRKETRVIFAESIVLFVFLVASFLFMFSIANVSIAPWTQTNPTEFYVTATIISVFVSIAPWFILTFLFPMTSIKKMRQFIDSWYSLIGIFDEWGMPFDLYGYDLTSLEATVRQKMIALANQIKEKEAEDPFAGSQGDHHAMVRNREFEYKDWRRINARLRSDFGRRFDILKSFGLALDCYEPYFNPQSIYFEVKD